MDKKDIEILELYLATIQHSMQSIAIAYQQISQVIENTIKNYNNKEKK